MKVLAITSGGDAPGMNNFLYCILRQFKNDAYASMGGFCGLVDGKCFKLADLGLNKFKEQAGSVAKCSRCEEFKTFSGFKKAVEFAKKFDLLIVLGGDGSLCGAEKLANAGIRVLFVPASIDNNLPEGEYALGFSTAVKAGVDTVYAIMPSMEAFDRTCIFESMGNQSPNLASAIATLTGADFLVATQADLDFDKLAKIIKRNQNANHSTCIIIKENIISKTKLLQELAKQDCKNVYFHQIGYVQRGARPVELDLENSTKFAKKAIKIAKKCKKSGKILQIDGKIQFVEFEPAKF